MTNAPTNGESGRSPTESVDQIVDGSLNKKLEELSENIRGLRIQIAELRAERQFSEENSKQLVEKAEKLVESRLASADEVVSKLENKLSHFYITSPANGNGNGQHLGNTEALETNLAEIAEQLKHIPNREFIEGLTNSTLEAITDMRLEVLTASDKSKFKN